MSDCDRYQIEIVEGTALPAYAWGDELSAHLESCPCCQEVLEQERELNALLNEPLPLPPADLVPGVMARIESERSKHTASDVPVREPSLPWAERFVWAASGAMAMYCLERLPDLSSRWFAETQVAIFSALSSLRLPLEVNIFTLVGLALVLLAAQGVMVYQVRTSAS